MSKSLRTLIEWAHYTLNFWWGCTKVSEACAHCYAEAMARRLSGGRVTWGAGGLRWVRFESSERKLAAIVRAAKREGFRPRVFVNSMSDTFEDHPALVETRLRMLNDIAVTFEVDFLLLTKRPENVLRMVPEDWVKWAWPPHVWIGTTVENQAAADVRIPALLQVPARVRFLSCEPLLGAVQFSNVTNRSDCVSMLGKPALSGIHWVIAGGESGQKARPMHPEHARSLRDQCAAVGVPFFFKQWGEFVRANDCEITHPKLGRRPVYAAGVNYVRVGKCEAGRKLDGVEHNAVPVWQF